MNKKYQILNEFLFFKKNPDRELFYKTFKKDEQECFLKDYSRDPTSKNADDIGEYPRQLKNCIRDAEIKAAKIVLDFCRKEYKKDKDKKWLKRMQHWERILKGRR